MSVTVGKRAHEAALKYMFEGFANSYNYISMSNVFKDMELPNCSVWALRMSDDNRNKSMTVLHHLEDRGVRSKLVSIPVTRQDWRAPLHIFEESYRQEQKMSGLITVAYESALVDKDYIMQNFVLNFFEKHLKSEQYVQRLLNRLRKMQTTDIGVLEFDTWLEAMM